jgi:hypothetical protein
MRHALGKNREVLLLRRRSLLSLLQLSGWVRLRLPEKRVVSGTIFIAQLNYG